MRMNQVRDGEFIVSLSASDYPAPELFKEFFNTPLPEDYVGISQDRYLAALLAGEVRSGNTGVLIMDSFTVAPQRVVSGSSRNRNPNIVDALKARVQMQTTASDIETIIAPLRKAFPGVPEATICCMVLLLISVEGSVVLGDQELKISRHFSRNIEMVKALPEFLPPEELFQVLALNEFVMTRTESREVAPVTILVDVIKKNPGCIPFTELEEKVKVGYRDPKSFLKAFAEPGSLTKVVGLPQDLIAELFPVEAKTKNSYEWGAYDR